MRSLRDLDRHLGGDVEGSYCSRKGLQEKKNLIIFEKPNFKNGGAGSSAWASPFFSSSFIDRQFYCTYDLQNYHTLLGRVITEL